MTFFGRTHLLDRSGEPHMANLRAVRSECSVVQRLEEFGLLEPGRNEDANRFFKENGREKFRFGLSK